MAANIFMSIAMISILKEKKFDTLTVALRSDRIAVVHVIGNSEIDISHVKQVVGALGELGGGKKFPLLISVGEFTLPTPEARNYIATAESDPFASAEAYVVRSLSQRLVGNVYISLNKPARPTRMFNDEQKATEWLKTFL